jgi:hypothetical protein
MFVLIAEEETTAPRALRRTDSALDPLSGLPKHYPSTVGAARAVHRIWRCRKCRALAVGEVAPKVCGKCKA